MYLIENLPEQRAPPVRCGVNESSCKGSGEKIAKCISLLQHARNNTSGFRWTILDGSGSSVSVETSHGNSIDSPDCQKLLIGLTKASSKLENDEEDQVDNVGPFATVPISGDTECNGTDRSEHEHKSDTPGDVGGRFVECCGKIRYSE